MKLNERNRRNTLTAAKILVAALMFLQWSCFPDYFPRRELESSLSDGDVIGSWRLSEGSARMLENNNVAVGKAESKLELFENKGCNLHNFFYDDDDPISGAGTWTIEHDVDLGGGLRRKNELRITIEASEKTHTYFLMFSKNKQKILLWRYFGDGDARQYIDYERQ